MIIDSHCHLDYKNLYDQLDDIIKRAEDNNVKKLLTICTTLESFEIIKSIISKHENIYGTLGIHPHETEKFATVDSKFILDNKKKHEKVIGIGETGLDFYYNHSPKNTQIKSFVEHIIAASELNIPIIVHSRNAEKETYEILKNELKKNSFKILIHCFTGTEDFAKKLLDLNCYISISGIITFNKSKELAKTVSSIPVDNLLVETDSPYLSPVPYRGKSNEPSYIIHTIKKISEIKNTSESLIIDKTTKNFKELFNVT
tara:strand:+ start:17 stop:790 length:774 start_codon:yes stop_codon:yes gene_type:complete